MIDDPILLQFFRTVANKTKHKHYSHVVAKRKLYRQLVLGEGIDELLRQYVRREDDALFTQRVRITQHITPAISKNLLDVLHKIPRSNSSLRILNYGEGNDTKTKTLETILAKFWGSKSFDDFVNTRVIELNGTDPNAFTVIEWKGFDGAKERIAPYPMVVSSEDAVDYQYDNNVLQYLIVRASHQYKDDASAAISMEDKILNPSKGYKDGHKFTLYGKDKTWTLHQISETDATVTAGILREGEPMETADGSIVKLGGRYFKYNDQLIAHNLGSVPAFRVGYYRDESKNGETFVNPLHSIEAYLMKTIKVNSEFDLVATLLALPQMVKYGQACPDTNCLGGEYANGATCTTCNGNAVKPTAPSSQDAIILPIPRNKDELLPLGDFIKYIHPPVEIVEFQRAYVEKLTSICKVLLYADDIFDKSQVAETATGKNLDAQSVYDALWPLAGKIAEIWNFGVYVIADLADLEGGLVAKFTFNKDFKLKSLDTLIADLDRLKDVNHPTLKNHIGDDIAAFIFADRPDELMRHRAQSKYSPFSGKSEVEIMLLLSSPFVTKRQKVLHAQLGHIFDTLETKFAAKNFYLMPRSEQRKAIDTMVDELIIALDAENVEAEIIIGS